MVLATWAWLTSHSSGLRYAQPLNSSVRKPRGINASMSQIELINATWPVFGMVFAMSFGWFFMKEWRAGRERDFKMRQEELYIRRREYEKPNNIVVNNENPGTDSDLGGYVTIDIPDDRKSIFHDLLKGFEEYAALKGYKVSISIDSSIDGKISFKIIIKDFGITGTRNSVKNDLDEYIEKIKSGSPIEEMPEVIDHLEHSRLIMALRNRITFLQQNYEIEKNIREFYQRFFERLPNSGFSHANPIFHISNGGSTEMDQRKYIANNSANISQGDNQNNLLHSGSITIGGTFSQKSEQIEKLTALIEKLNTSTEIEKSKIAVRQLENIKDEISDAETPDKNMISKWLEKAKSTLSFAELGAEIFDKAKAVYESFGQSL